MKLYGLSGLGADERAFEALNKHINNKINVIAWIEPKKNESLASYALRLSEAIDTTEDFVLIGVSFGGMIATEIAKLKKPVKLILISSAAMVEELPKTLLYLRRFGMRYLPANFLKPPPFVSCWAFSVHKERKALLLDIINKTDPKFVKWALGAIATWNNKAIPQNFIRIHGEKDRLIPIDSSSVSYTVANTGHFMIVEKAKEVAEIIEKEMLTSYLI